MSAFCARCDMLAPLPAWQHLDRPTIHAIHRREGERDYAAERGLPMPPALRIPRPVQEDQS